MNNNTILIYEKLKKKKRNLIISGVLFVSFLFTVNTYAWFTYTTKSSLSVDATVIGWDVNFYNEDASEMDITIDIKNLYPGMDEYKKKIVITNESSLDGVFSYEISDLKLVGELENINDSDELIEMLNSVYPFKVEFKKDSNLVPKDGGFTNFYIIVTWPFENNSEYTLVSNYNKFQNLYPYYTYDGSYYIIDNDVNSSNYLDKVNTGLYINSDDLDSFWGEISTAYQNDNQENVALSFKLKLKVEQEKINASE